MLCLPVLQHWGMRKYTAWCTAKYIQTGIYHNSEYDVSKSEGSCETNPSFFAPNQLRSDEYYTPHMTVISFSDSMLQTAMECMCKLVWSI